MKVVKDNKKEIEEYQKKFAEHKKKYLKDHTIEDMVYENGSAIALLYKEIQRLSSLIISNLNQDGKEDSK